VIHCATKISPFHAIYGFEPRLYEDQRLEINNQPGSKTVLGWVANLEAILKTMNLMLEANRKKEHDINQRNCDRKMSRKVYSE
jgi:hypothetical protein